MPNIKTENYKFPFSSEIVAQPSVTNMALLFSIIGVVAEKYRPA